MNITWSQEGFYTLVGRLCLTVGVLPFAVAADDDRASGGVTVAHEDHVHARLKHLKNVANNPPAGQHRKTSCSTHLVVCIAQNIARSPTVRYASRQTSRPTYGSMGRVKSRVQATVVRIAPTIAASLTCIAPDTLNIAPKTQNVESKLCEHSRQQYANNSNVSQQALKHRAHHLANSATTCTASEAHH